MLAHALAACRGPASWAISITSTQTNPPKTDGDRADKLTERAVRQRLKNYTYMKPLLYLMLLVLLPLPCLAQESSEDASRPLLFGSVAMDSPVMMQRRLQPLTNYLGKALNRQVILKLSTDMPGAINALVRGDVDFAYLTPVAYVNAHQQGQAQIVVRTVTNSQPTFKLMIVVRDDSPIRSVAALAGKRFAFGDPAALLQRAVVVGAGMPLQRLGEYAFVDHYDNVIRGVLAGDYDAGIVLESTAQQWQGRGIRVLYSSDSLPPYNIAASAGMDGATIDALRKALLALDSRRPEYKSVITALAQTYTGFAPATDSDYDIVRKLIKPFM